MRRTVQKWQGAGNDFIVDVHRDGNWRWSAESSRAICDRHRGFGADGLLEARLDGTDVFMRLWNADGSVAEMSGNGLRCLTAAVLHSRDESHGVLEVVTEAGRRVCEVTLQADSGVGGSSMGIVTLGDTLDEVARLLHLSSSVVIALITFIVLLHTVVGLCSGGVAVVVGRQLTRRLRSRQAAEVLGE